MEEEDGSVEEVEYEVVEGPFAILMKTLELIDVAWDHAVNKDDFSKMVALIDKTLEVNDRYMAVQVVGKDQDERIERPAGDFGFSTQITEGECPTDIKSR